MLDGGNLDHTHSPIQLKFIVLRPIWLYFLSLNFFRPKNRFANPSLWYLYQLGRHPRRARTTHWVLRDCFRQPTYKANFMLMENN